MAEFKYEGTAYRQASLQQAPWIINFVAPAEELRRWAGIPRRSEHNLAGFQRAVVPERVSQAKGFFRQPENQSPTALIVGLHPAASTIDAPIKLEFLDEHESIRRCRLTVVWDDQSADLADLVSRVKSQIAYRLEIQAVTPPEPDLPPAQEMTDVADGIPDDEQTDEGSEDDLSANELEEDDEEGGATAYPELELGRSILQDLLLRLNDETWCADHREELADMAKPATIIDGQHRVEGAAALERSLPFTVCALFECPWPEQVFQFTVVNYTAKGIPDSFITANAALSLTTSELDNLKTRLVQAGVKVIEYELMNVVQFNPRSPFYELVNLSERSDPSRIGYRTMVRIARGWYDARHLCFQKVLPNLYPTISGRGSKARRITRWREKDWGEFFVDFWSVVRDHYKTTASHDPGHTLWDVGHSQLVVAVVLLELQEQFFRNLNAQDEEFFLIGEGEDPLRDMSLKLEKRARRFVDWFPAEFFSTKWGMTSLSIGPGRIALRQVLDRLVETNGKYQYKKSTLVTGKTE